MQYYPVISSLIALMLVLVVTYPFMHTILFSQCAIFQHLHCSTGPSIWQRSRWYAPYKSDFGLNVTPQKGLHFQWHEADPQSQSKVFVGGTSVEAGAVEGQGEGPWMPSLA